MAHIESFVYLVVSNSQTDVTTVELPDMSGEAVSGTMELAPGSCACFAV